MSIAELASLYLYKYPKWALMNFAGVCLREISGHRLAAPDGQSFVIPSKMKGINCFEIAIGRYERDELDLLRRGGFHQDHTIIEIGANIGYLSRYAFLEFLASGGKYVCVEPNFLSQQALRANMEECRRLEPNKKFEVLVAAICEPEREGRSANFLARNTLGSGLSGQVIAKKHDTITEVSTLSLGSIMRDHAPNGASLICDAEGGEIPMILNDPDAFKNIRQILIELHGPEKTGRHETPAFMISKLHGMGFAVKLNVENSYLLQQSP